MSLNLSSTFLNKNISQWDVSKVINMSNMFTSSLYVNITSKDSFSFEHYISFSYDKLVGAFFHNSLNYINKFREQCVPFELFNDISKNTDEFNVFLLVDNTYIIEEYLKLSIEEKEQLIKNETMNNFFNEINAIINFKEF